MKYGQYSEKVNHINQNHKTIIQYSEVYLIYTHEISYTHIQ